MSGQVQLSFTPRREDVSRLVRGMGEYRRKLGKTMPQAITAAAGFIGRSLSASTRRSPKVRKVGSEMVLYRGKGPLMTRWFAHGFGRNGQPTKRWMPYRIKTDDEAKRHKQAFIGRSGMAAAAWRRLGSRGGRGGGSVRPMVERVLGRAVRREERLRGNDPQIVMRNFLDYSEKAFRTRGKKTIDTVMERAAAAMSREIERKLAA